MKTAPGMSEASGDSALPVTRPITSAATMKNAAPIQSSLPW